MLTAAKNANLLLMFLLELGVLFSVGYWGMRLDAALPVRVVAALAAVAVFIAIWAIFGAGGGENATVPLHGWWRVGLEIVWFGGGAGALALAGRPVAGAVFVAVFIVNAVLRLVWKQV
ncbi:MAG TPA: DUF2568 domain-containing protein [Stackebrandtia sp.]|jgi:hypothetical protein|uniref:DUF2568 domain-containing protein n=1 Tax=Stackebrandtia sp. TaxID=2023065 RepID=UPI002D495697|nr:DUF2568 domain-containing protein [Stackebrandtia sp.]HZE38166.1 DUF2568 domain-containing protein [Stackebrandtia sp.]